LKKLLLYTSIITAVYFALAEVQSGAASSGYIYRDYQKLSLCNDSCGRKNRVILQAAMHPPVVTKCNEQSRKKLLSLTIINNMIYFSETPSLAVCR